MSNTQWKKNYTPQEEPNLGEMKDLIIYREKITETYDEEGNYIKKRTLEPINLTKKLAETVQTLKAETIEEKIEQLKKELEK